MYDIPQNAMNAYKSVSALYYIITAIAFFVIGGKANIKNRWVAFVPFVQVIVLLHVIDKSGWNIFLLLIPVVNFILMIIWVVKGFLSFSVNVGIIVLSIIFSIFGLIMLLVVAFSDKYQYSGSTRFTA
jgi:hypothetical protein